MSEPIKVLANFFFDREIDKAFSTREFVDGVWGGSEPHLEDLLVQGYLERSSYGESGYTLTPKGRSEISARWGGR